MQRVINATKQWKLRVFWYLTIVSFGCLSIFTSPGISFSSEIKDVVLLAKIYDVEHVDTTKLRVEENVEAIKRKIKKLNVIHPVLSASSFSYQYTLNVGEDLDYVVSMIESRFVVDISLIVPVGTMGPPLSL